MLWFQKLFLLAGCQGGYTMDFSMANDGLDNIHLFLANDEAKSQANRVEPNEFRRHSYVWKDDTLPESFNLRVEAHRGDVVMASTTCPEPPRDDDYARYFVQYTEDGNQPVLTCGFD